MTPTSSLAGKRVLVTGGSRGIGAAIVRRLASQGATVAVNYRSDRAAADALVGELRDNGCARLSRPMSVTWRRPTSWPARWNAGLAAWICRLATPGSSTSERWKPGSLPYLSLEPAFRRGHGMICQALAEGGIDEEALRDLLVAVRERGWPLVFAIDASTYPRPWAVTSPGREFHHHSCPGSHGSDGAAVKGRAFQWLSQVSFAPDSWTAPQDQVRVGAGDDATRKAAAQILAHSAWLRAAGKARVPLYELDAGYDEAPLAWDLRDHLDKVQVLVRLRNDRVMYRDPEPRVPGRPGPNRRHGTARFECKDPATWGAPDQELSLHDEKYGQVSVMCWGGLHPKLFCRGRFAGFAEPPVIRCHLIRVTVTRLPNGRKVPGPLWLRWSGPGVPDPDLIWRAYLRRFRRRAHLPVRQARPGLGQGRAPPPGSGDPLDLDHHRRDHHAPPRPAPGRRPPPALGTPPQARETQPRPDPPRFRPASRAGRHPRQRTETLQGRTRAAQRPP
jgi:hypothetical protein